MFVRCLRSHACVQAKERRTLAEVLPFLCQLYPDDECLQLVCTLALVRNKFADFRDKMERERTFLSNDVARLAALVRLDVLPEQATIVHHRS